MARITTQLFFAAVILWTTCFAGETAGQVKQEDKNAVPPAKVVGRAIPAQRAIKAPAGAIRIQKDGDGDPVVQQWMQQFIPQLQQMYRGELHLLRLATGLTKAQYEKIAADGDEVVKSAARKVAQSMRNGGDQEDVHAAMMEAIAKAAAAQLSPEQLASYRREVELRTAARKRLILDNLVAMLDEALILRTDQRDKLRAVLAENWNNAWNQTQIFMYGGRYFPPMPTAKIDPILTDAQRSVWRSIPKNQVRFGFNFGMNRGGEVFEEVWDDEPATAKPPKKEAAPPKKPVPPKPDEK